MSQCPPPRPRSSTRFPSPPPSFDSLHKSVQLRLVNALPPIIVSPLFLFLPFIFAPIRNIPNLFPRLAVPRIFTKTTRKKVLRLCSLLFNVRRIWIDLVKGKEDYTSRVHLRVDPLTWLRIGWSINSDDQVYRFQWNLSVLISSAIVIFRYFIIIMRSFPFREGKYFLTPFLLFLFLSLSSIWRNIAMQKVQRLFSFFHSWCNSVLSC